MVHRIYGISTSFQTGFKAHSTNGTHTSSVKLAKNLLRDTQENPTKQQQTWITKDQPNSQPSEVAFCSAVMNAETQSWSERREWETAECLALSDTPASLALWTYRASRKRKLERMEEVEAGRDCCKAGLSGHGRQRSCTHELRAAAVACNRPCTWSSQSTPRHEWGTVCIFRCMKVSLNIGNFISPLVF